MYIPGTFIMLDIVGNYDYGDTMNEKKEKSEKIYENYMIRFLM